jgi:microcystin-dependent protein
VGPIPGSKIQTQSITSAQIALQTITAAQIAPLSLTPNLLAPQTITSNQIALGTIGAAQLTAQLIIDAIIPPGSIVAFGGATPPQGWRLCDGSALNITDAPRLYTVISTNWGAGYITLGGQSLKVKDFNLPDLRGMFLRGVNGSQSNTNYSDPDVSARTNLYSGGNTGNAVGSVQSDQFRSHVHKAQSNFIEYPGGGNNGWQNAGPSIIYTPATQPAGGNETRPVNVYVNYIIKY